MFNGWRNHSKASFLITTTLLLDTTTAGQVPLSERKAHVSSESFVWEEGVVTLNLCTRPVSCPGYVSAHVAVAHETWRSCREFRVKLICSTDTDRPQERAPTPEKSHEDAGAASAHHHFAQWAFYCVQNFNNFCFDTESESVCNF